MKLLTADTLDELSVEGQEEIHPLMLAETAIQHYQTHPTKHFTEKQYHAVHALLFDLAEAVANKYDRTFIQEIEPEPRTWDEIDHVLDDLGYPKSGRGAA